MITSVMIAKSSEEIIGGYMESEIQREERRPEADHHALKRKRGKRKLNMFLRLVSTAMSS